MNKKAKIGVTIALIAFAFATIFLFIIAIKADTSPNAISKSYNKTSQTIAITNSTSNITLVQLTLTSPIHNYVPTGADVQVAEINLNLATSVFNFIDSIQSINLSNGENITKVFRWKKAVNITIDVPTFDIKCSDVTEVNGTYQNCTSIQNGTIKQVVRNWTTMNFASAVLPANITLGLFTDVNEGDHVEWIPTLNIGGTKSIINEWAEFDAYSLLYNYSSGDNTNQADYNAQWNCVNFTVTLANTTIYGVAVKIFKVGTAGGAGNLTIRDQVASTGRPNATAVLAMNETYQYGGLSTDTNGVWANISLPQNPVLTNDTTYFLCLATNDSGTATYLRWRMNNAATLGKNPAGYTLQTINAGSTWGVVSPYAPMYRIYGTLATGGGGDTIYPQFINNQSSPNPASYVLNQNYIINVTIVNSNGSALVEFDGVNYTMTNVFDTYNKTFTDLKAGTHNYRFSSYGNGTSNNANSSILYSLIISKASSSVKTYLGGVEGDSAMLIGNDILLNGTLVTGKMISLNLTMDGIQVNYSTSNNLTYTYHAIGSPRTIIVNTSSIGDENNSQSSEAWNLALNNHIPQISNEELSPSSPTTYSLTQVYNFNVTVTDSGNNVNSVLLVFNNTNYTATNVSSSIYNYSFTGLKVGNYSYYWYANDTLGDANSSKITSIYIAKANATLVLAITPSENVTTGITTTAMGSGCLSPAYCNLTRNGVEVSNPDIQTLTDGLYYYNYSTNGNENYTAVQSGYKLLNVTNASTDYPQFSSLTSDFPNPQTYNGTAFFYFNSTWIDSGGNNSFEVFFVWNNTIYDTKNISSNYYANITDYAVGNYTYYWYANDTGGNMNQTGNNSFRFLKSTPLGAITILPSTSVLNGTTTNVSATESNRGDGDVVYTLYRDNINVTNPDVQTFLTNGTRSYRLNSTSGQNYSAVNDIIDAVLLVSYFPVYPFPTNMFNNSLTTENLTINSSTSITRFIAVPQSSVGRLTTAIMNISSQKSIFLSVNNNFSTSTFAPSVRGIWSNGTNLWIATISPNQLFYINNTGGIISNITLSAPVLPAFNSFYVNGIYSNGTDLWFLGWGYAWKIYHTNITGGFIESFNFTTGDGIYGNEISSFTSNRSDFWAVTYAGGTTQVNYINKTGKRVAAYDISSFSTQSTGIYNNGSDLFIGDYTRDKIFQTNLTGGLRESINAQVEAPNNMVGIYSNGTDFWIGDDNKVKVYEGTLAYTSAITSLNITIGNYSIFQNSTFLAQNNTRLNDFSWAVNAYLANCTYFMYYCQVPVVFSTNSSFVLQYFAMNYSNREFIMLNQSYSSQVYETEQQNFSANFSYDAAEFPFLNVSLIYNGTNYPAQFSNTSSMLNANVSIFTPQGVGTKSFYWLFSYTDASGTSGTSISNVSTQTVILTNFTICGAAPQNVPYLNFTFHNDTLANQAVTSTFNTQFVYWLGDRSVNKTLNYISAIEKYSYAFCVSPQNKTLYLDAIGTYSNSYSQSRNFVNLSNRLTNSSSVIDLLLLPNSNGIYISFIIQNNILQRIPNALVSIVKVQGNVPISQTYTDGSGITAVWLDTTQTYTITVTASGYNSFSSSLTPSTSPVTYTLQSGSASGGGGTGSSNTIYLNVLPTGNSLINDTPYTFAFNITSSNLQMSRFGFYLWNKTSAISGENFNVNSKTGTISNTYNTGSQQYIIMRYYYIIGGQTTNGSQMWYVYNPDGDTYSINHALQDLNAFTSNSTNSSQGIFGIVRGTSSGDFSFALIIFVIVLFSAGVMSYKYGITATTGIVFLIFAVVLFVDVGAGLMPNPVGAVPHFVTIMMAVILIGFFVKEMVE